MRLNTLSTMLLADDLQATIAFYTNALGFTLMGTLEDPPTWCSLRRDDVELMFVWFPPHDHGPEEEDHPGPAMSGVLYVRCEDVAALHEQVKARAQICEPLTDQPYGMREFAVLDPSGYRVRFGERM